MGFPEENNWTMTIVTNIYIYIDKQWHSSTKKGETEKKKKMKCVFIKSDRAEFERVSSLPNDRFGSTIMIFFMVVGLDGGEDWI